MKKSKVYYNENDPFAAKWLEELIKEGLIAWGDVDTRSIKEVKSSELVGYKQHHFFAGIGGWSYALRLAGWPDDREVWTGSCPCQSFSAAGKRLGTDDPRHLWPDFFKLIEKQKPATIFGEQVASKDGRIWLAGVRADLEMVGYAVGAADLSAASVGAPHIRQRIYWVADTNHPRWKTIKRSARPAWEERRAEFVASSVKGLGKSSHQQIRKWRQPWELSEAIECEDGWRRIEPSLQPLAVRVPSGMVQRRGYGNAIVPQVAAEFILVFCETKTK